MSKDIIFVHILKTGGTTINTAMQDSYWQTETNFNYRHIKPKTHKSNAGDIFDPANFEKYKKYKVFMMLRDPVDRVLSEYYYFRERKNFMELFRKEPATLKAFVKNRQTQNGMISFLKGRRIFPLKSATEHDLDDVLDAIDEIPVHIGIFEQFDASMQYFTNTLGLEWKKEIQVKRMTFRRPKASEIDEETRQLILDCNALDLELYNYGLEKFNKVKPTENISKINFIKDKYSHVIPYAQVICLFEFCLENKKYIFQNKLFFRDLTFYLLRDKGIRDGKIFTTVWNQTFTKAVSQHFAGTAFNEVVQKAYNKEGEPLEELYQIAKAIDAFLKKSKSSAAPYYASMKFDPQMVSGLIEAAPKTEKKKKGFFSRFFGK